MKLFPQIIIGLVTKDWGQNIGYRNLKSKIFKILTQKAQNSPAAKCHHQSYCQVDREFLTETVF